MEKIDLNPDPLEEFKLWYQQAQKSDEADPAAMALATATKEGKPSIRVVLYKGICKGGFLIYTNYGSRKAHQLLENPYAALAMYWPRCYRQIRVEGRVEKMSSAESQQYFETRQRDSQIAAWASEQSQEIPNRDYLLDRFSEMEEKFGDKEVYCPEDWGGYRLIPDEVEFWQGQQHRLHDRFLYRREGEIWKIVRLAP